MSLTKDLRFLILIFLVLFSAYLIISPYVFRKNGAVVSFIETDTGCVKETDLITHFEGLQILNAEDFRNLVGKVQANSTVSLTVNSLTRDCRTVETGSLGFLVKNVVFSNLKFGIDIEGGTRVLLKPKNETTVEKITETVGTLNNRINFYGLRDIRISPVGQNLIQIEIAGATGDDVRNFLARQGKFEGRLLYTLRFSDGVARFVLADNTYSFIRNDTSLLINGMRVNPGEKFSLMTFSFEFVNATNTTATIYADVFQSEDIVAVLTDPQFSRISRVEGGFEFVFTVQITRQSAEKFATLTKNQPTTIIGTQRYIEPKLVLFLDEIVVSQLNIAANIAGQATTSASIQGFETTQEAALQEKLRLESILRSGSLPVELEIVKVDTITQTAGQDFINSTFLVAVGAAAAVSLVIFTRYRKIKIAFPMILISFSEILIVLGFAAFTQVATGGNGWVLDIPAIAGLISLIGVGVNQLIIITDQMLLEKEQTVKYRYKTAMSMIFNSAYIVVAAMLPLIILGVGTLRGFAITTILGVLIGIIITRPAYTSILERIEKLV